MGRLKDPLLKTIVLASSNAGKLQEIQMIFEDLGIDFHLQSDFQCAPVIEDGLSFIENALKKARQVSAQTQLPALADDSGLCVEALQGAPGIYSARYAGDGASDEENVARLLQALKGVPVDQRGAHFTCALALVRHAEDPEPFISVGLWQGQILLEPIGSYGFGYDPVFYVSEWGCSSAELEPQVKNRISHRAKALFALRAELTS